MNDFELHYLYQSRSNELIAEAEAARTASRTRSAAKSHRRDGVAARIAKALGRKEERPAEPARRFQLAK